MSNRIEYLEQKLFQNVMIYFIDIIMYTENVYLAFFGHCIKSYAMVNCKKCINQKIASKTYLLKYIWIF